MEFKISKEEILSGDISKIKKVVDNLSIDRRLSLENENSLVIRFVGFTVVDLSEKLQKDEYKSWFKKLDSEFPYIPFFLDSKSKTLLFFMMGCIDYSIKNSSIIFNETDKNRYTKEKAYKIRQFCMGHNIDPMPAIERLALSEAPARKPQSMETYLKRFGAIAFMTKERKVQISVLIDEIPSNMKIWGAFLIEKDCPQPFFSVFLQLNDEIIEYKAIILTNLAELSSYCHENFSVQTAIIIKSGDDYQSYPELETKIEIMTMVELDIRRGEIFKFDAEPEKSVENQAEEPEDAENIEENKEQAEPEKTEEPDISEDETLPVATEIPENKPAPAPAKKEKIEEKAEAGEEIEEEIPENETSDEKIARLERQNAQLQEKVEKQAKLIEDYEEELKKKRSVKGFFKRFFS